MTVFKNNPRQHFYRYSITVAGKRMRGECVGCETLAEAQAYESRLLKEALPIVEATTARELVKATRRIVTVSDMIALDAATIERAFNKPAKRDVGDYRRSQKVSYWQDFVAYMACNHPTVRYLEQVTVAMAENYIAFIRRHGRYKEYADNGGNGEKYAAFTLNLMHDTCRWVFHALRNDTKMDYNPFADIERLDDDSHSHEAYTADELNRIFDKANDFVRPLFMIGLFSGLRLVDICRLRKDGVDFNRHFIFTKTAKTGAFVSIPMHATLENYLRGLIESENTGSEYVMPEHCSMYDRSQQLVSIRVTRFLESIGISTKKYVDGRSKAVNTKGIHSLRHTFCSIAGVVGIPETVVQSIVGHMTPAMTRLYNSHVEEADKLKYITMFDSKVSFIQDAPKAEVIAPAQGDNAAMLQTLQSLPADKLKAMLAMIGA